MSILMAVCPDLYLSMTAFVFVLGFVVASSLLIEYQAIVLSPADYRQLAFQPVTSPTFFAARLTSVTVYVWAITASFSAAPLVALFIARHGGAIVALVAAAAAAAVGADGDARRGGSLRRRAAAACQPQGSRERSRICSSCFGFVVYGSYMIVPILLGEAFVQDLALPKAWWTLVNPASWFAAWVTLAAGAAHGDRRDRCRALGRRRRGDRLVCRRPPVDRLRRAPRRARPGRVDRGQRAAGTGPARRAWLVPPRRGTRSRPPRARPVSLRSAFPADGVVDLAVDARKSRERSVVGRPRSLLAGAPASRSCTWP